MKVYRRRGDGIHAWTEDQIAAFEAHHPIGSKARLALALGLYTIQRGSDVVRMGWQHVEGDTITVRQEKTGAALTLPIHPELMQALKSISRTNMTFLTTRLGVPYRPGGFQNWFRKCCDEAGLPKECSYHGLRKTGATRLIDAGCTTEQVKAMTGHATHSMVRHYTKGRDQLRLARQAMATQMGAEREQGLASPKARIGQPGRKS